MRRWMKLVEAASTASPAEAFEDAFWEAYDIYGMKNTSRVSLHQHGVDEVEISYIAANVRGQGIGNRLMRLLTDLADRYGVVLYASPASDADGENGLDTLALVDWYERWGFGRQPGVDAMRREPEQSVDEEEHSRDVDLWENVKPHGDDWDVSDLHFKITQNGLEEYHWYHTLTIEVFRNNELIGYAKFAFVPNTKIGTFWNIAVENGFRRKGVATAIFDYLEALGYTIKPSDIESDDMKSFWKSRKRRDDENALSLRETTELLEAGDADLYHFTTRWALKDILLNDRLGLDFGPSLTRDTNHIFVKGAVDCCLVIDARKLTQRYRLTPFFGDIRSFRDETSVRHGREAEERADHPISPIIPLIKEIVISPKIAEPAVTRLIETILKGRVPISVGTFEYGTSWFRTRVPLSKLYAQKTKNGHGRAVEWLKTVYGNLRGG